MRVIVIRPLSAPVVEEISPGLEPMQKLVEGYVTCVGLAEGIDLWCNDEGAINGMRPNRLVPEAGQPICGTMFIARSTPDGDTVGLTDADVAEWIVKASTWPMHIPMDRVIAKLSGGR